MARPTENDLDRLARALLERLGVPFDHVLAGTLSAGNDGSDTVTIRWECVATMPADDFEQLVNQLGLRTT